MLWWHWWTMFFSLHFHNSIIVLDISCELNSDVKWNIHFSSNSSIFNVSQTLNDLKIVAVLSQLMQGLHQLIPHIQLLLHMSGNIFLQIFIFHWTLHTSNRIKYSFEWNLTDLQDRNGSLIISPTALQFFCATYVAYSSIFFFFKIVLPPLPNVVSDVVHHAISSGDSWYPWYVMIWSKTGCKNTVTGIDPGILSLVCITRADLLQNEV